MVKVSSFAWKFLPWTLPRFLPLRFGFDVIKETVEGSLQLSISFAHFFLPNGQFSKIFDLTHVHLNSVT